MRKYKLISALTEETAKEVVRNEENWRRYLFRLPRHFSSMIMHTFADWGNTGQNMAESLGITTASTTKVQGG